jgi:hypothetical protein
VNVERLRRLEQRDRSADLRGIVNDAIQATGAAVRARDRGDLALAARESRLATALARAARAIVFADAPSTRRTAPDRRMPL